MGRSEHFFHGTVADISDMVRPAGRGNASVWGSHGYRFGQRADEHAFATDREDQAWDFAQAAQRGAKRPGESLGHNRGDSGRARVYRVAAAPDMQIGAYHPDHPRFYDRKLVPHWEHISKTGFPVQERIDIKPGHQGTFPIDWRPYSAHPNRSSILADVNHPTPKDQYYGHHNSKMHWEMAKAELDAWDAENYPKRPVEPPGQMHLNLGPQFEPKEA